MNPLRSLRARLFAAIGVIVGVIAGGTGLSGGSQAAIGALGPLATAINGVFTRAASNLS